MKIIALTLILIQTSTIFFNIFFNEFNLFKKKYKKIHFNQNMHREFKAINAFQGNYNEILFGSSMIADIDENHKIFQNPFNFSLAGSSLKELYYHLKMSNIDEDKNIYLFLQHYMVNDYYKDNAFIKKSISQNYRLHIIELFIKNFVGSKIFFDYKLLSNYASNEKMFLKKNGFNEENLNNKKDYPSIKLIIENEQKFLNSTTPDNYEYSENLKLISYLINEYNNLRIIFLPYNRRLQNQLKENGILYKYQNFRLETFNLSENVFDFTNYGDLDTEDLNQIKLTHHDGIHIYTKYLSLILDDLQKCIINSKCEYDHLNY